MIPITIAYFSRGETRNTASAIGGALLYALGIVAAFTGLGLALDDLRLVVVKSMQHFHAAFAPIASGVVYVDAPGAVPPDYGAIPYTKRSPAYWPRVDDPFQEGTP